MIPAADQTFIDLGVFFPAGGAGLLKKSVAGRNPSGSRPVGHGKTPFRGPIATEASPDSAGVGRTRS